MKKDKDLMRHDLGDGDVVVAVIRVSVDPEGNVDTLVWTPKEDLTELETCEIIAGMTAVVDVYTAKLTLDAEIDDLLGD